MSVPGFDAEHSLYRTSAHYTGVCRFGGTASSLEPASVRCRDRPGCRGLSCPDKYFCHPVTCGCCSIGSTVCGSGCCSPDLFCCGTECCPAIGGIYRCVHGADGQPVRCGICPVHLSYELCGNNCCPWFQCDPVTLSCTDPSKKCENCKAYGDFAYRSVFIRCLALGGTRHECMVRASIVKGRVSEACDWIVCGLGPPQVLLPH
jgi:hypothetical protein